MTRNRRLTLASHGVIELVLGLTTLASPVLLDFGTHGVVTAVVLGSLLTGLAVTIGGDERSSIAWHHLLDLVAVIALAVAAFGLAVTGEPAAGLFFSAVAVVQAGLNVSTRYVATR